MLRVVKHIHIRSVSEPVVATKPQHPCVRGWDVQYMLANKADEIGTIMCYCYRWNRLPMPKKETLRTPTMLPKWFAKLLRKRYGIVGEQFTYSDTTTDFRLRASQSNVDLTPFVSDCIIYPLFDDEISAYKDIDSSDRIPTFLTLEIRSFLEKHNWNHVCR